jgi:pyruvate ferredoxin oxidoreductase beta subunit
MFKSIKDLPKAEYFSAGHRLCQGCPEAIISRLVTKVLGPNVIIVTPTGCLEVSTTAYPETAWKVPWVHVAFENAAAVASGIEAGIRALKRKGIKFVDERIHVVVLGGDGGTADMAAIAAAHRIPYVAVASISHPLDFANKVKKAAEIEGPAYVHVLAPCPTGWRFDPSKTVEVARLGVLTGMWVLYEIEMGKFRVTVRVPRRRPVRDYLRMQGRFSHLIDEEIEEMQKYVDEEVERINKSVGYEAIGPVAK